MWSNERGQYGRGNYPQYHAIPLVGADAGSPRSIAPWIIGGGLAVLGVALFGAYAASTRPQATPHEKEVRAWETEFPGLPWYMDQVKSADQLDTWERARDSWERKHPPSTTTAAR
jgi:hypothetical protein